MNERTVGYILLIIGIIIIIAASYSAYIVFARKQPPIKLFSFPGISIDTNHIIAGALPQEVANFVPQNTTDVKPTEIISSAMINDTLNIFAHLMLMGFFMSAGYKVAALGVMLVRPVVVRLRGKEINSA